VEGRAGGMQCFLTPQGLQGPLGPRALGRRTGSSGVSPRGVSVVHPELELCSVREQRWLQFDERQRTRRRRFYVCVSVCGRLGICKQQGLSHISNFFFVYAVAEASKSTILDS